jgi:hypothetical protein
VHTPDQGIQLGLLGSPAWLQQARLRQELLLLMLVLLLFLLVLVLIA